MGTCSARTAPAEGPPGIHRITITDAQGGMVAMYVCTRIDVECVNGAAAEPCRCVCLQHGRIDDRHGDWRGDRHECAVCHYERRWRR
jgi:hypothetical protein